MTHTPEPPIPSSLIWNDLLEAADSAARLLESRNSDTDFDMDNELAMVHAALSNAIYNAKQHPTPDSTEFTQGYGKEGAKTVTFLIEKLEEKRYSDEDAAKDTTGFMDGWNDAVDTLIAIVRQHEEQPSLCIRCEQEMFDTVIHEHGESKCPSVFSEQPAGEVVELVTNIIQRIFFGWCGGGVTVTEESPREAAEEILAALGRKPVAVVNALALEYAQRNAATVGIEPELVRSVIFWYTDKLARCEISNTGSDSGVGTGGVPSSQRPDVEAPASPATLSAQQRAELDQRIEDVLRFTSNRPSAYCHMFYNAQKLIEDMRGLIGGGL
jgi:hypothetical protein